MVKIARWTMAHRGTVVVAWIVAAVGIFAISSSVGKKTASNFTLPGTGSQHAVDLLCSRFPAQAGDADQIVFHARTATLHDAADRAAITQSLARVARSPARHERRQPVLPPARTRSRVTARSPSRRSISTSVPTALPKAAVNNVIKTAESARSPTLQVELGGQAIEQAQQASLGFATIVGIAAAILILLHQLRVVQRDGSADCDRAARPRGRRGRDHARQPRRRHAELRLRAGADDRPGGRRRLCAVHRHALPRELPAQRRRCAAGDRGSDEHLGSRRRCSPARRS